MKKILLMTLLFFFVLTLSACEDMCIGPECIVTAADDNGDDPNPDECEDCEICEVCEECPVIDGIVVDNALPFTHLNGHGVESDKNAFILLEWKLRDYVRYQVTYLSCTCRAADVNYWQVAFVEINLSTNDIRTLSFDLDSGQHYTAGTWGDSSPIPETGKTYADFEAEFIPWLVGKTSADLDGIVAFTNEPYYGLENTVTIDEQDLIDGYAGSSVSTNNMIRVMKALLEYHEEKND